MKQEILFRRLFASLLLLAVSSFSWAYDFEVDGVYYYKNPDGTSVFVTYGNSNSYSGSVIIPSTVRYGGAKYTVTSIGEDAFRNCSGLTSITIPKSITSIDQSAFYYCSGLTSVTLNSNTIVSKNYSSISDIGSIFGSQVKEYVIGDEVTSIGNSAFRGCTGLISVMIGNGVTTIGDYAFSNCSDLTSITIPESVTNIGGSAFSGCSSLTSVTIPESVTDIGGSAFSGCSSLTSVTIPENVTSIGYHAFSDCSGLTSVTLNSNAIASKAYTSGSNLISIFGSQVKEYVIGDRVTSIGNYTFRGCSALTSVTISNSVTAIGDYVFEYCSGLTSITIPKGVTTIGSSAFYGCSGLTSVTLNSDAVVSKTYTSDSHLSSIFGSQVKEYVIGDGVTGVGERAFWYCDGLTSVTIPNSVTTIGNYAFVGCSGITSITIPESVTSIGGWAFEDCSGLTSVTIPNSVLTIGRGAFGGCSGLTSITVAEGNMKYDSRNNCNAIIETVSNTLITGCNNTIIPNSVTTIGDGAFRNCDDLTSITIPNSVTSIGRSAFSGCSGLTSVTIPESVTSIGLWAFSGCPGLTSIMVAEGNTTYHSRNNCNAIIKTASNTLVKGCKNTVIPNSVMTIGYSAFESCYGLTSITIPESVTNIGTDAFSECSDLTSVICYAEDVPNMGSDVFYDVPQSTATLYVPAASVDAYKAADQWRDFGTILPIDDELEGISPLLTSSEGDELDDAPVYDLNGRRLTEKPKKGIYIQNGKKYVAPF